MAAKAPTKKDGATPSGVVPSTGTHVVAYLVGDQCLGYRANLGDKGDGEGLVGAMARARRFGESDAIKVAEMWQGSLKKGDKGRYEARPCEDLFAGEEAE